ncbi:hypothetical protein MMC29_003905, partial [Sticta canariensis]|nr:hypothetical protein [Sticta canariensis]
MALSSTSPAPPTGPDLSIPLISLTPLITRSPLTISTAQSLLSALRSFGFIYLTDAPFSPSLISRVFSQSASFFARPQSQKDALAWTTPRANRGYVCIGREKVSQGATKEQVDVDRASGGDDLKESYEIGRDDDDEENLWPDKYDEQGADFRETMLDFFDQCKALHVVVMRGIALGLGFDEGYFDGYVSKGDNTLRLLHYPPVAKKDFKAGRVRAGEHSDYGTVTFLFQDKCGGLQVERPGGEGYVDVKPVEGAIVLNSGDLLARWSNDLIRSTMHRVVEPPRPDRGPTEGASEEREDEEEDVYPARYSVAYFCNPDFDRWIEALPVTYGGERGEKKYEGVD